MNRGRVSHGVASAVRSRCLSRVTNCRLRQPTLHPAGSWVQCAPILGLVALHEPAPQRAPTAPSPCPSGGGESETAPLLGRGRGRVSLVHGPNARPQMEVGALDDVTSWKPLITH